MPWPTCPRRAWPGDVAVVSATGDRFTGAPSRAGGHRKLGARIAAHPRPLLPFSGTRSALTAVCGAQLEFALEALERAERGSARESACLAWKRAWIGRC